MASQPRIDPWAIYAASRWLILPVLATEMDKINIAGMYLLGARVHALFGLKAGAQIANVLPMLADADEFLEMFIAEANNPKRETSRVVPVAEELRKGLAQITALPPVLMKTGIAFNVGARVLTEPQVLLVVELAKQFEAVLCSEMPSQGIFYVTSKRAYSTDMLLTSADASLSEEDRKHLSPLALENIQEAGRCLLFDRYTAVGFHILRAVEDAARCYYELITDHDAKTTTTKGRSMRR